MARNRTSFTYTGGNIQRNIRELEGKTEGAIRALCEYHATRGEAHMKTNAPWTDRTGAARNGLFTRTEFPRNQYIIIFAHSVHYGIWLEVANSGEYQIILPTVRHTGRQLMADLHKLYGRLGRGKP